MEKIRVVFLSCVHFFHAPGTYDLTFFCVSFFFVPFFFSFFFLADAGPGRAVPRPEEGPLVASGCVSRATSQRLPQDEPHGGLPGERRRSTIEVHPNFFLRLLA